MRSAVLLAVALFSLHCASDPSAGSGDPTAAPGAASGSAEASSVQLHFDWSPGLEASVTTTKTRTRVMQERTSRSATSRYTLRVSEDGENLRIHFADATLELAGDVEELPEATRAQLVAQVADLAPDYVVSKGGEFLGVHDLPGFQTRLREFFAGIFHEELDPRLMAQLQELLTSEALLNARAAEQWNAAVGAWVDAELEVGAGYTLSSREPVAAFPGQQIQMNYSFSANRIVPCQRGGVERRCAELEMRSVADPEDTKRLIRTFLEDLGGGPVPQGPLFTSLAIENVVRVTTEPDGLVPHGYSITRTMQGTVAAGGTEQPIEQLDRTEVGYVYP